VAEPLEGRLLMSMSLKLGGSGFSNLLATDSAAVRQQKQIIDPPEPLAGSVSTLYDASKVTIVGATPGPGYENANFAAFVEVKTGNGNRLQLLNEFLVRPLGEETGYVQVRFELTGQPGKIQLPREWITLDVDGTDGLDPAAIDFLVRPNVPSDSLFVYRSYAAREGEHGNPEDFLITNDGTRTRLGPAQLTPADTSNRPKDGSIVGTVFQDFDGDGQVDRDDRGMADVTVFLDLDRDGKLGDNEPRQPTNEIGGFVFDDLEPGDYLVRELTPEGFVQTNDPQGDGQKVTARAGQRERLFFGNARPATLFGNVFNDLDNDGLQDVGEGGLAGALVYLDLNNDSVHQSGEPAATSGSPGGWTFAPLAPGTYVVRQVPPAGYAQTAPVAGFFTVTLSGGSVTNLSFGDHSMAPTVTSVFVRGDSWSNGFMKELARLQLGDGSSGFRIPFPTRVTQLLPWVNVNQVVIQFNRPVYVQAGDLVLDGIKADVAATTVVPLALNQYLFTFPRPIGGDGGRAFNGDRITLTLDGDAPNGVATTSAPDRIYLDGDSNGMPGGDFRVGFNVLQGDANHSGGVNVTDYVDTLRRLGSGAGASPRYSVFNDVNGSGTITAADAVLVRSRIGRFLPAVQAPTSISPASVSTDPSPLRLPTRRSLFGDEPVLV
jgi:hypothetical protein